jgi:hypothetical protein
MTTAPYVELGFNPTDLRPRDLPRAGAFLGSPADALEAALAVARAAMVDRMKSEVRGLQEPTHAQLVRIADLAWQALFWRFRKVSAPIIADAYLRAYRAADAGDVPMSVIYSLADKHAEKIGDYFHDSSRDALAQGFNTLVNRRLPAKAAADRVMDAFGLTPRQMRAYTSHKQFETPIADVLPRSLKARARAYIDKSFTTRARRLSRQEEHNIDQQAQQFAWMWLQDKGRLSEKAQKIWITARDERVCPVCGPLHGKKVRVNEQFKTPEGDFWTPGVHPNCRCVVRILENRFAKSLVAKDLAGSQLAQFNRLHPRADDGRFGAKARTRPRTKTIDVDEEFARITRPQRYTALERTVDTDLEQKFAGVIAGSIHPQTIAPKVAARGKPVVVRAQPQTRPAVQHARPKVVLSRPQAVANQIAVKITPPKVKAEFTTKLTQKLETRAAPDTGVKVVRTGTKSPGQPIGLTVYHVMTPAHFDKNHPGRLRLDPDIGFTSDPNLAAEAASQLIETDVNDVVHRIVRAGSTFTDKAITGHGYQLNESQVRELVEFYARSSPYYNELRTESPELIEEPMLTVQAIDSLGDPIRTEKGDPMTQKFSAGFIGQKFGVDRYPFDVRIVAVKEGFAGKTYPEFVSDDPLKPQLWAFEGDFQVNPETLDVTTEQNFAATIMEIEPMRHEEPPKRD